MYFCNHCGATSPSRCCLLGNTTPPRVTSRIENDGHWHVWLVYVDGKLRRKGWTPAGRMDAAREAAKDVAELTKIEKRRSDAERDQMWTPNDVELANG